MWDETGDAGRGLELLSIGSVVLIRHDQKEQVGRNDRVQGHCLGGTVAAEDGIGDAILLQAVDNGGKRMVVPNDKEGLE